VITWYSVPNQKGFKRKPEWMRSAGIEDTGDVYVPAVIVGNEMLVFLCAGWDNEPAVYLDEHLFVRASWMAREFPKVRDICIKIEANVRSWPGGTDGR
jgi:hypothetical protein